MLKRFSRGKTLSVAERNLLQSALAGENLSSVEYAQNAVELASILDVDRRTIQRWRKIEGNPGVRPDGRYHVPSWRAFKLARQGADSSDDGLSQSKLRARQILLQNQKLEFQIALLRREYVPACEVERWGGELGTAIHLCAPSVVGVSVPEAEARLKELEDEILQQLHLLSDSFGNWKNASDESAD